MQYKARVTAESGDPQYSYTQHHHLEYLQIMPTLLCSPSSQSIRLHLTARFENAMPYFQHTPGRIPIQ